MKKKTHEAKTSEIFQLTRNIAQIPYCFKISVHPPFWAELDAKYKFGLCLNSCHVSVNSNRPGSVWFLSTVSQDHVSKMNPSTYTKRLSSTSWSIWFSTEEGNLKPIGSLFLFLMNSRRVFFLHRMAFLYVTSSDFVAWLGEKWAAQYLSPTVCCMLIRGMNSKGSLKETQKHTCSPLCNWAWKTLQAKTPEEPDNKQLTSQWSPVWNCWGSSLREAVTLWTCPPFQFWNREMAFKMVQTNQRNVFLQFFGHIIFGPQWCCALCHSSCQQIWILNVPVLFNVGIGGTKISQIVGCPVRVLCFDPATFRQKIAKCFQTISGTFVRKLNEIHSLKNVRRVTGEGWIQCDKPSRVLIPERCAKWIKFSFASGKGSTDEHLCWKEELQNIRWKQNQTKTCLGFAATTKSNSAFFAKYGKEDKLAKVPLCLSLISWLLSMPKWERTGKQSIVFQRIRSVNACKLAKALKACKGRWIHMHRNHTNSFSVMPKVVKIWLTLCKHLLWRVTSN